jgi:hypothetical protein
MPKVVAAFVGAEARDALAEQRPERLDGPAARGAQDRFELGEAELDRIEVGAVRRQIPHRGAGGGEDLRDAADLVCAEVVGDHDVAGAQGRHEDLFEIREKAGAVDRALEDGGRGEAGHAQRGQKRTGLPAGARRVVVHPRARQTAAVAPQQIRGDAGFVEKREPLEVPRRRVLVPGGARDDDVRSIVFRRPYSFF